MPEETEGPSAHVTHARTEVMHAVPAAAAAAERRRRARTPARELEDFWNHHDVRPGASFLAGAGAGAREPPPDAHVDRVDLQSIDFAEIRREDERQIIRDMNAMRRATSRRGRGADGEHAGGSATDPELRLFHERVRAYLLRQHQYNFVDDDDETDEDDQADEPADAAMGESEGEGEGEGVEHCTRPGHLEDAGSRSALLSEYSMLPGPCEIGDAQSWWMQDGCQRLTPLAATASTTDHVSQNARNVLFNDENFWSSTGSADGRREESLTVRLANPLARVRAVQIAPFRARFQFGEPVYPPRSISIEIGTSLDKMVLASPRYRVKKTDFSQLFLLRPSAPPGGYVRITFHGSLQQQLEDMRYYIAVRHFAVFGTIIDTARLAREDMLGFECPSGSPGASMTADPGELLTQGLTWSHLAYGASAGARSAPAARGGDQAARAQQRPGGGLELMVTSKIERCEKAAVPRPRGGDGCEDPVPETRNRYVWKVPR